MQQLQVGLKFLSVFSADIFTNIRLILLLFINISPVIVHCVKCYCIRPQIFRELNLHAVGYHQFSSSFSSFSSCRNYETVSFSDVL